MTEIARRLFNISTIKKSKTLSSDEEILEWLKPLAYKLEIPVEELVLNLHIQNIFKFDDITNLLNIEDIDHVD